MSVQPGFNA